MLVGLQLRFNRTSDGCIMVYFSEETQDYSECFVLFDAKTSDILTGCSPIPRRQNPEMVSVASVF